MRERDDLIFNIKEHEVTYEGNGKNHCMLLKGKERRWLDVNFS